MTEGAERSGVYAGTYGQNVYLYNNTFYADGADAATVYGANLSSEAGTDVAENNIFYFVNSDIQKALIGASGNVVDYNLYYPMKDTDDDGAHSLGGDPMFKTPGSDFHLTELSPARKSAATISIFSDDYDGTPRPAGAWDMGAYQYSDGTTADAAADAAANDSAFTDGGADDAIGAVDAPPGADGSGTPDAGTPDASTLDANVPVERPVADGGDVRPTQATAGSDGCACTSGASGTTSLPLLVALTAISLGGLRRRRRSWKDADCAPTYARPPSTKPDRVLRGRRTSLRRASYCR
jgi:MYXO-CTERM domain-containing protein